MSENVATIKSTIVVYIVAATGDRITASSFARRPTKKKTG
jgi:hypothetical protein